MNLDVSIQIMLELKRLDTIMALKKSFFLNGSFCLSYKTGIILLIVYKSNYRIFAKSFRGNYSFLNLALCSVTFGHST
jgi:hypothetical protein